jgi:hypothetical protein
VKSRSAKSRPLKKREPFRPFLFPVLSLAAGLILLPRPVGAIHFPDIVDVQRDYQVAARKDGLPADLFHKVSGDSNSLHLEWQGSHPVSARYEQSREFDPDSFTVLTSAYGEGATWHEWEGSGSDSAARKAYPGLQQQWFLKGYGGEKGWLGSGVTRGRYFLVFREASPSAPVTSGTGPLRRARYLVAVAACRLQGCG